MPATLASFLDTIARESECVELFAKLLDSEKALLTAGNVEGLAPLIEEKEALALRLEALARQRDHYLADNGLSSDRNGMTAWLSAHPGQMETEAAWKRTLTAAARARETNRLNGQLIQIHQQFTGQALDILTRRDSPLNLYGPDGRTAPPGDRQINDTV